MAVSIILTELRKGQPSTNKPKGQIENIKFSNRPLEELTGECNLSKLKYRIYRMEGPWNNRKYLIEYVVQDIKRRNLFITISDEETTIR